MADLDKFDKSIFDRHKESGCPGEMFYDDDEAICCTKDDDCPILQALFNIVIQSN